jgi:hypothetical protein
MWCERPGTNIGWRRYLLSAEISLDGGIPQQDNFNLRTNHLHGPKTYEIINLERISSTDVFLCQAGKL